MTLVDLERTFELYVTEMKKCERAECHWALLHLAVVVPDLCGSLETPGARIAERYVRWCRENFPQSERLRPGDRYQLRNSLLHEDASRPSGTEPAAEDQKTQYATFSFVDPGAAPVDINELDEVDADGKKNLSVDIKRLADDTVKVTRRWFRRVAAGSPGMDGVARNLEKVIEVKPKVSEPRLRAFRIKVLHHNRRST